MSLVEELDEYPHDFYYEYYHEETAFDIWNNCVILSVLSILPSILRLVVANFVFGCLISLAIIPTHYLHFISGGVGVFLIFYLESNVAKLVLLYCWITALSLLYLSTFLKKYCLSSNFLKVIFIVLLILSEYLFVKPEIWLNIRGIVMILAMKVISLAEDMENLKFKPSLSQYFGYTLCGANILFGPWISFNDYLNLYKKSQKNFLIQFCAIFKVVSTALLFLTLSNCWSEYFINENSNRWLVAYKEAFSFRTSHYFISFLAEAGMIATGFTNKKFPNQYRFTVTEPLEIEFPSSLSVVVKKWNQPMHDFLKKYIYQSWLRFGQFNAILATFLISSFLHGLELKISMVLINIGIFSYLQVAPRARIAEIFDCCVKVRPCKDCKHKYKRDSIVVRIILVLYSLGTIFHLAYLGILMDPSTDEVGIYEKWQNLYFISHIVMFFNVMIIS